MGHSGVDQVPPAAEADGGVESLHLLSVGREVPALRGHLPVSIWLHFPVKVCLCSNIVPFYFFPHTFSTTKKHLSI